MAVEVAAWNVAKAFGNEKRTEAVCEGIKWLDSDVVLLCESFATDASSPMGYHEERIEAIQGFAVSEGYQSYTIPYQDKDTERVGAPQAFEQYLTVLGRRALEGISPIYLKSRNAFRLRIRDQGTLINSVGLHMDDRSETKRLGMVSDLRNHMHPDKEPTLIFGDFNAMHRTSMPARIVRSKGADFLASHIPQLSGDSDVAWRLERAAWLSKRLMEMGDGRTMQRLVAAGLKDADYQRRSTFTFSRIAFGQMDHILTSRLRVLDFKVRKLKGSDHRVISARLEA